MVVLETKVVRMRLMSRHVLILTEKNRRFVPLALLLHFYGVCVYLSLAIPLARFYTHYMFFVMANAERE